MNNDTTNSTNFNTFECWTLAYEKCPVCGGYETEYNQYMVLTSMPPQYKFRCKCGHHWSGSFSNNSYQAVKQKTGLTGWICPVCGVGVSPYQDHCPCCSGKSLTPTWVCDSSADIVAYRTENFMSKCPGEASTFTIKRELQENDRSK